MILKPQDIVVVLKMVTEEKRQVPSSSLASMGVSLSISSSEVHGAGKRLLASGLANKEGGKLKPNGRNLEEFLTHGIRYVFVPDLGGETRGMPTSYAAPPLVSQFNVSRNELPPVWPDSEGDARGMSFSPLYPTVPKAARQDSDLYQLLALVDAIRSGRAREREMAVNELVLRLKSRGQNP